MQKEFTEEQPAAVCVIAERAELEGLLKEFPELFQKKGQTPPPHRVYTGQTFRLGIPDEDREKIFYRAQYPPKRKEIDIYDKIVTPLIESGVLVPSDAPHNNPVMLVPKKNPGDYRMVIDIRLVNKVCKPVGGMCASTLDIIKMMSGVKIFTTLDCKNAFYSLLLHPLDMAFTSMTFPGKGKFKLTRMPMGAKASTAALYQAMVATLGEALYRYTLVWTDDIIIFSASLRDHINHVKMVMRDEGIPMPQSKLDVEDEQDMKLVNAIDTQFRKSAKVVEILERRMRKSRREYLVRWNGVEGPLSWETWHAIKNPAMVDTFDKMWDQKLKDEEEQRLNRAKQSFTKEAVKTAQEDDEWCKQIKQAIAGREASRYIKRDANQCVEIEGTLFHKDMRKKKHGMESYN